MKTQFDKSRIVNVYSPNLPPFKLTLTFKTTFNDVRNQIIQGWSVIPKRVRIFNQNGHELIEQDLQQVLDGNKLYITLFGQDLDASIIFQEYEIVSEIGKGGQGTVLLGKHKFIGSSVAIKITRDMEEEDSIIKRESKILKELLHRNIVKVFQTLYFSKTKESIIIMEYLDGVSILFILIDKGILPEQEVKIYIKQIVEALLFCHSKTFIHRDLKLENIMLVTQGNTWVKLIDFGLAGVAGTQRETETMNVGTLPYMSPEVLNGKLKFLCPCVDVWGLGVIMYSLLYGKLPFKGRSNEEKVNNILQCNFQHELNVSDEAKDLINRIFVPKHNQRISMQEILAHKWIGGNGFLQFRRLLKKQENPYLKNGKKKYDYEIRKKSICEEQKVKISLPLIRCRASSQDTIIDISK
ncbi:unnamed protein product (macronuclear) [Paramecium tetraurelia]|uniref:Protein kinase domain-containing protein n=1 Tax=Paramecium tetraurelia TaxID=5888 RepID=A0BR39_PARTE|nr:uncharacterized protein GSPATT00031235001 [Paramecium tetraurelia]CAK61006.1 unnamed protein product [Paramecium tetraurelia]|eukprot:XP_001428404.1 hypothetical protein (macronuclear) [Paramecium tetraurelia strain d4-2]